MNDVCQHGSLRDKCEICERDEIIASAVHLLRDIARGVINPHDGYDGSRRVLAWLRDNDRNTLCDRTCDSADGEARVRDAIDASAIYNTRYAGGDE